MKKYFTTVILFCLMTMGAAVLHSCRPCNDGPVDNTVSQITPVARVISEVVPGSSIDFYRTRAIEDEDTGSYDSLSIIIYLYEYLGKASQGFSFINQTYACDPAIFNDSLESLSIVSDTDYDADHPAGSDLKDIFLFNTEAYSDMGPFDAFLRLNPELYSSKLFLRFLTPPVTSAEHNLSISLKVVDGETFHGEINGLLISP